MTLPQAKALERLNQLIDKAQILCQPAGLDDQPLQPYPIKRSLFVEWKSGVENFLQNQLGKNHLYYHNFIQEVAGETREGVENGVGVLKALKEDLEKGYLSQLEELIHAELFADFLQMAEVYFEAGYKDQAAIVAGGVLEEHLRKLALKHNISLNVTNLITGALSPKKAENLNSDLAQAKVYTKLEQKSVSNWLELASKAGQAKYNQYSREQVELMLRGITDFTSRYLA
jgi:hypothetical protein